MLLSDWLALACHKQMKTLMPDRSKCFLFCSSRSCQGYHLSPKSKKRACGHQNLNTEGMVVRDEKMCAPDFMEIQPIAVETFH